MYYVCPQRFVALYQPGCNWTRPAQPARCLRASHKNPHDRGTPAAAAAAPTSSSSSSTLQPCQQQQQLTPWGHSQQQQQQQPYLPSRVRPHRRSLCIASAAAAAVPVLPTWLTPSAEKHRFTTAARTTVSATVYATVYACDPPVCLFLCVSLPADAAAQVPPTPPPPPDDLPVCLSFSLQRHVCVQALHWLTPPPPLLLLLMCHRSTQQCSLQRQVTQPSSVCLGRHCPGALCQNYTGERSKCRRAHCEVMCTCLAA